MSSAALRMREAGCALVTHLSTASFLYEDFWVYFWKQETPEVGSSMKTMEGLATSSTAIVRRLRCSTLRPYIPV